MTKIDVIHSIIHLLMYVMGIYYMRSNGQLAEAIVLIAIFQMLYDKLDRIAKQ